MRLLIDHKHELGGRVEKIVVVGGPPCRGAGKERPCERKTQSDDGNMTAAETPLRPIIADYSP